MQADEKRLMSKVMESLIITAERTKEELQELMDNPCLHDVMRALVHALEGQLATLFNYKYIVDGNGKRCDIVELTHTISDDIRKCFKDITGSDYKPDIIRSLEYRKQLGKEGKEALLLRAIAAANEPTWQEKAKTIYDPSQRFINTQIVDEEEPTNG